MKKIIVIVVVFFAAATFLSCTDLKENLDEQTEIQGIEKDEIKESDI